MKRAMTLSAACALAFALFFVVACSRDEASDAANDAAASAQKSASDMMNHAGASADTMTDSAKTMAGNVAGNAVEACRKFASAGAWGQALEVCKKAHEMMPDDMALEHAYQQAQAAAGQ